MRFAVAVLIGCVLSLGQNAAGSEPDNSRRKASPTVFVRVDPGTRIYFEPVRGKNLIRGPALKSNGVVTVTFLGDDKKFTPKSNVRKYIVKQTGVLIPQNGNAEDVPKGNVYKSKEQIFYVKGFKDILIPLSVLYSKSDEERIRKANGFGSSLEEENDSVGESEVISEEVKPRKMKKVERLMEETFVPKKDTQMEVVGRLEPDKNCNGEVTVFVLQTNGVLRRLPPDPYLPTGINLSFTLKDNFLIRPKFVEDPKEPLMKYVTGSNGDLIPHTKNKLKIRTDHGEYVTFVLAECGTLIPVREERHIDGISYTYNGQLIHKGDQFPDVLSNKDSVLVNNVKHKLPNKEKSHKIHKRSLYSDEYMVSGSPSSRYYPPVRRTSIIQELPQQAPILRQSNLVPIQQSVIGRPRQTIVVREPPPATVPVRRISYGSPPPARVPARIPVATSAEIMSGIQPRAPPRTTCMVPPPPPRRVVPMQPCSQLRRPVPQHEIPIQQVRVPVPQQHVPVSIPQQVRVPVPQREIPLQQIRMPIQEPELTVIPPTAIVPASPCPPCEASCQPCKKLDLCVKDEKGTKITLEPEFTEKNDVVLYKLTCKGNLVRFPSCKEPEYGFPVHFKLLLEEFVMVPIPASECDTHLTYILQENGDLAPSETNKNTFKKAPGSLLYFMLGKDNVLFPVQQKVDKDGSVTYYYQNNCLLKLASTANKPLHFSTLNRPLFAYYNGLTVMTLSSKPRLNSCRGSNWKNHCSKKGESESKDIFLAGPCGQLIRVTPFKTKGGSTVIYEMDNNGILYRSPKDKKKCIILKSYIVLKEGILLPSNETCGYMFMASKNGDMFPYLYPDGKLEAPRGESIKYLLCEKGILLPMELEIVNNQICYFFLDVIVYKEKVYTKDDLDHLSESNFKLHYKNDCDELAKQKEAITCTSGHFKPFTCSDGSVVYYEKHENLLKRHPMEVVPKYLSYTMGSFEIQTDGSLFQIRYQNPDSDVINLMLEPNGDLMEDCRNVRKPSFDYYVLDVNGNLIAVEARKTKKSIYFYKNNVKVGRVCLPRMKLVAEDEGPELEKKKTPLGLDPLRLMEEPEPDNGDFGPMCIPVPLKSLPETGKGKCEKDGGKCEKNKGDSCKETMALELEINDEVIEEIRNWANKCDKMLSRREVEESLTEALQGLSVSALYKETPKQR